MHSNHLIHTFSGSVDVLEAPAYFTYPFHYVAHPLAQKAAEQVQKHLLQWGLDTSFSGKMFGVLVVKDTNEQLGYLTAFSGNSLVQFNTSYFVPPIADATIEGGYFRVKEDELTAINHQITVLENANKIKEAHLAYTTYKEEISTAILAQKHNIKQNKACRAEERQQAKVHLHGDELQEILEALNTASIHEKNVLKRLKRDGETQLQILKQSVDQLEQQILDLKQTRKTKSLALQKWFFNEYQLLNAQGEAKAMLSIFEDSIQAMPPAGAGDCAAPRLLQYAYKQNLTPLAMAEFWWGQSPKTIVRQHGSFYPSCTSKCKPILGHMLKGLQVEQNPLARTNHIAPLDIIYQDEAIIVINKPEGILSVPGKTNDISVYDLVLKECNKAQVVHRLDMATSGLLVFAKSVVVHKTMQEMFASRQVKKRYVALLDGIIKTDSGKIELPLRVDLDNRPQQMVCNEHGKAALTIWRVAKRSENNTRIHFFPITGRTHQLRVHAAHILGLHAPIVGDQLYGTSANRLYLHAEQLEFLHPITNKKMIFRSKAEF